MTSDKRALIDVDHPEVSMRRQCDLIGLNRSSYYYQPAPENELNLTLMRLLDEQYLKTPIYGYRKMTIYLRELGYPVNFKRVARLMTIMGVQSVVPKPNTSQPRKEHKIYPYLLRDMKINQINHVWSADITYVPMNQGFMYLVAILDWYSRYVLAWEISNTLDSAFCLVALENALKIGTPTIFNTDQGSQFTALAFTDRLHQADIQISMDGRGRYLDNIFIERLWRSLKYERIYLNEYETGLELGADLATYFDFYNHDRYHQSLGYKTPAQFYLEPDKYSITV